MNKKIESVEGKLIVEVLDETRHTQSGIVVAKSEMDRSLKCRAISVGGEYTRPNGKYKVRPPCLEGDVVYIQKPSRKPDFRIDGKDYYSIPFICVLLIRRDVNEE